MFQTYNSLAEVPEAFREHYVMKGGKAVPEVSTDHPLVVNNALLVSQKTEAETQRDEARRDLESASASKLPPGHVAVKKADAELLASYKGLGTPDELTTLKTEHGTFKEKAEAAEASAHAAAVGEAMGWDAQKTARLVPKVFDLSQVEVRDHEGKKMVVAKVKGAGDALVEKPFEDVVRTTAELSDLLPSLAGSQGGGGGTTFVTQGTGVKAKPTTEQMVEANKKAAQASGKYDF